jgi:hypothetical protein
MVRGAWHGAGGCASAAEGNVSGQSEGSGSLSEAASSASTAGRAACAFSACALGSVLRVGPGGARNGIKEEPGGRYLPRCVQRPGPKFARFIPRTWPTNLMHLTFFAGTRAPPLRPESSLTPVLTSAWPPTAVVALPPQPARPAPFPARPEQPRAPIPQQKGAQSHRQCCMWDG